MFGIFGVTKDANLVHGYLSNFIAYAQDSIGILGFDRGAALVAQSEWAAGTQVENEGQRKYLHFRLCIPFSSFFVTIDNDTSPSGSPSPREAKVSVTATDDFNGFGLFAYTEKPLIQVYAINRPDSRATARASMLMSRFKAKGAIDMSQILKGQY